MLEKLYRIIWKPFGRPFTYILRDSWVKYEILWILGLLMMGGFLGEKFGFINVLKYEGLMFIGIVLGHLFWGTKHILGQKGDGNEGNRKR